MRRRIFRAGPCPGCWTPAIETSWRWQLQGPVDTLLDIEMYDVDGFEATKGLVNGLHADGSAVVCQISTGSWERWCPDAGRFPDRYWAGRTDGREAVARRASTRRAAPDHGAAVDMCARKVFDGVEFDNVDGYANATGFPLTGADQLRYNVFLANAAHRRGFTALLKNDLG